MDSEDESAIIKGIIFVIILLIFFVLVSQLMRQNIEYIDKIITGSLPFGIPVYILLAAIDAIAFPTIIPLIPVASHLYGFLFATLYLIIGWVIGISISFYIARKFGRRIVGKFISLKKIDAFEKSIPEKNVFMFIFFLRIFLPLEVATYGFGIFRKISARKFFLASFLGIIPAAVVLSYIGALSLTIEVTGLVVGLLFAALIIMLFVHRWHAKRAKKLEK